MSDYEINRYARTSLFEKSLKILLAGITIAGTAIVGYHIYKTVKEGLPSQREKDSTLEATSVEDFK